VFRQSGAYRLKGSSECGVSMGQPGWTQRRCVWLCSMISWIAVTFAVTLFFSSSLSLSRGVESYRDLSLCADRGGSLLPRFFKSSAVRSLTMRCFAIGLLGVGILRVRLSFHWLGWDFCRFSGRRYLESKGTRFAKMSAYGVAEIDI